jgi:Rrf2 family nitric oxide-sensitive transcriptional repressor
MALAQPAAQIGIGQVIRATEGTDLPAECFSAEPDNCIIARVCRLRGVLQEAVEAFYEVLDGYTLADLVHNRSTLIKVLNIRSAALSH